MAIKKVPSLDGSGKIFNKHIPDRLQDAALNATYATLDSGGRQPVRKDELYFNVKDFGAKGDGGTNDTASFNAAISAASSGNLTLASAVVFVPKSAGAYRLSNVNIPSGVRLVGNGAVLKPLAGTTGALLTFPGTYAGIEGLLLSGGYYANASAISLPTGSRWNTIDNCRFDGWGGRAIYDQGIANWISRILAMNCLQDADSLTTYAGVLELAGTDAWVRDVELTASRYPARGMSTSKFACAMAITGANHMVQNAVCETSDHGVYIGVGATQLNLSGVRGELCYGHGWVIAGGSGRISNPMALRNSQAGDLLYDGFHVNAGASTSFLVSNAWSESATSPTRQNFGIYDGVVSRSSFNRWANPNDIGSNIKYFAANTTGTSFGFPENPPTPMTASTATPNVAGNTNLLANNTSAVTVTAFNGGVNGQKLLIRGDGFTTLANNATINPASGSNLLLASGTWYRFIRVEGVWVQLP